MFMNPMSVFLTHKGEAGRTLSPRLWANAQGQALAPDGSLRGRLLYDDFSNFGNTAAVASNVGRYASEGGAYYTFEDTGALVSQIATNCNGVIALTTDADDNQEVDLTTGGNTGGLGLISDTAGDDRLLIFEARFRVPQIVTQNLFIGLGEEGLAVTDGIIDDSGDHTSKDLIGFSVNEDAASTLVFSYRKAGQTEQFPITALTTLVADTFYNVGFAYNPKAKTAERIKIYLNNTEQATKVTGTNIAAATFPDGEELAMYAAVKNVTDITTLQLDSWAFYQAD